MSETPIGDSILGPEDDVDEIGSEEFTGDVGNPDDLPAGGPGEDDDDGTAAETGAVIDDDEDPGTAVDDQPFNVTP